MSENYRTIMAYKDYRGAPKVPRMIPSKKEFQTFALIPREEVINYQISSNRTIVEKLFGRLAALWTLISHEGH